MVKRETGKGKEDRDKISGDEYFIKISDLVATKSKDNSTSYTYRGNRRILTSPAGTKIPLD